MVADRDVAVALALLGPVGAVAARRAHARDEVHMRRGHRGDPPATRFERFRLLVEVVHSGYAGSDIGVGDLWRDPRVAGRGPVGVDVEEAGQQRLALGVDHRRAAWRLHAGADLGDTAVPDDDVGQMRGCARRVEHRRADDRHWTPLGLRRAGERQNSARRDQASGTPTVSNHAHLNPRYSSLALTGRASLIPRRCPVRLSSARKRFISPFRGMNLPVTRPRRAFSKS